MPIEKDSDDILNEGVVGDEGPSRAAGESVAAGGASAAEADVEGNDEVVRVKVAKDPIQPSPEEVARHNISHVPFRAWCKLFWVSQQTRVTQTSKRRSSIVYRQ